jgi:hypothetical protein
MNRSVLALIFVLALSGRAFAAIGCSLDDPDRDVKKLFPGSSGYKTTFVTIKEIGGETLKNKIEERLGDRFDPIYENLDVPYAYYTVLKGKEVIGYIHGVNQKGKFGSLQLVTAVDLEGRILAFYFQKISSPESGKFRSPEFTSMFQGLSLADFSGYDISGKAPASGKLSGIIDPSRDSNEDFRATMRGIKKNLILLDEFLHPQLNKGGK